MARNDVADLWRETRAPRNPLSARRAGGMGEVCRARDTRLDRSVAIKVLASHLSSSPELRRRLEREARAIGSLINPANRLPMKLTS